MSVHKLLPNAREVQRRSYADPRHEQAALPEARHPAAGLAHPCQTHLRHASAKALLGRPEVLLALPQLVPQDLERFLSSSLAAQLLEHDHVQGVLLNGGARQCSEDVVRLLRAAVIVAVQVDVLQIQEVPEVPAVGAFIEEQAEHALCLLVLAEVPQATKLAPVEGHVRSLGVRLQESAISAQRPQPLVASEHLKALGGEHDGAIHPGGVAHQAGELSRAVRGRVRRIFLAALPRCEDLLWDSMGSAAAPKHVQPVEGLHGRPTELRDVVVALLGVLVDVHECLANRLSRLQQRACEIVLLLGFLTVLFAWCGWRCSRIGGDTACAAPTTGADPVVAARQ
mmetsp:Transcript_102431/g.287133  ORF Transcript_102431/g.287133 Transcript_102431/m.287133 type:complete len:340 (+) Transcript_102431:533-1552(+)